MWGDRSKRIAQMPTFVALLAGRRFDAGAGAVIVCAVYGQPEARAESNLALVASRALVTGVARALASPWARVSVIAAVARFARITPRAAEALGANAAAELF